jgi:hypothetical protein
VLRAPAVTPRDEEMRPSGTLQSPTTGSLAEMMRDADREDQIAAARALPRNPTIQLPDAPLEVAKPVNATQTSAQNTTTPAAPATTAPNSNPATTTIAQNTNPPPTMPALSAPPNTVQTRSATIEELPSYVPAPKSLISDRAAATVATVNPGTAANQNAVLTSMPNPTATALAAKPLDTKLGSGRVAHLSLLEGDPVMKVGEKRKYAVQLNSDVPLSLALLTLKFDPKVVKVHAVTAGGLLSSLAEDAKPLFTPSIDANGVCMISISSLNGKASFNGSGALLFIELEAIGAGDAALAFVKETLHLVATDARDVTSEIVQGTATVKQ